MSTWILLLLLILLPISSVAKVKQWNEYSKDEQNAAIWIWICIIAAAIGISISASVGAFFVMSRRNQNQGGQVMVVRDSTNNTNRHDTTDYNNPCGYSSFFSVMFISIND
ncbi:hypothetical protein L5515_010221 [Caenorhabditis briggsae]|uniref:Uncharacterized protein n=1 Tax=Caenorhabditis briggsae TaxID=6238 RepID=A0AAE9JFL6_CAEBR|nr:hypothetical protein L5515_010221 [Caenorhabditis briggsae]